MARQQKRTVRSVTSFILAERSFAKDLVQAADACAVVLATGLWDDEQIVRVGQLGVWFRLIAASWPELSKLLHDDRLNEFFEKAPGFISSFRALVDVAVNDVNTSVGHPPRRR